jgi:hypothetical protein
VIERTGTERVWVEKPEERNHLEDLVVSGKVIRKLIFKKWDEGHGLD